MLLYHILTSFIRGRGYELIVNKQGVAEIDLTYITENIDGVYYKGSQRCFGEYSMFFRSTQTVGKTASFKYMLFGVTQE